MSRRASLTSLTSQSAALGAGQDKPGGDARVYRSVGASIQEDRGQSNYTARLAKSWTSRYDEVWEVANAMLASAPEGELTDVR